MSGFLHAISSKGKEKWKYPVFNFKNNWSSPTIGVDGTIYVGSESYPPSESGKPEEKKAHIYALNPDGTLKWSYDTGGNWSTSTGSIAKDGTVYMSGNDCKTSNCQNALFAFNGQTGKIKWKFLHGGVMESSASLGADGTIYFGVKGKDNPREGAKFFALNPNGTEKWSFDSPCGNSIIPGIATDGSIYWGDWDGGFYKISPEGKILWKVETPKTFETLSSSPAIGKEGTVYFGSLANHFFAYFPDGKQKWSHYFENGGINSSPAIGSDGTIYVGLVAGELIAFGQGQEASTESQTLYQRFDNNKSIPRPVFIITIFFLLIITTILIILLKKNHPRKIYWLIVVFLLGLVFIFIIILFSSQNKINDNNPSIMHKKINTMEEMFKMGEDFDKTCPDKVEINNGAYTAILGQKRWEIKNMRQIDWVSEQCPNTVWSK